MRLYLYDSTLDVLIQGLVGSEANDTDERVEVSIMLREDEHEVVIKRLLKWKDDRIEIALAEGRFSLLSPLLIWCSGHYDIDNRVVTFEVDYWEQVAALPES